MLSADRADRCFIIYDDVRGSRVRIGVIPVWIGVVGIIGVGVTSIVPVRIVTGRITIIRIVVVVWRWRRHWITLNLPLTTSLIGWILTFSCWYIASLGELMFSFILKYYLFFIYSFMKG